MSTSSLHSTEQTPSMLTWLCVGGCPRSGTTLLNFILNSSPEICLTNEVGISQLIPRIDALFYRADALEKSRARHKGRRETWWSKNDVEKIVFQRERCFVPVLHTLFMAQFADEKTWNQVRYLGDKHPRYYISDFDKASSRIEQVSSIHISRHPYDVVNSMLSRSEQARLGRDGWRPDESVRSACVEWARAWKFACRHHQEANFFHLKYEDLVFDSGNTLNRLRYFLGLGGELTAPIIDTEAHSREKLDHGRLRAIDAHLGGVVECWDRPLNELTTRFPNAGAQLLAGPRAAAWSALSAIQKKLIRS